MNQLKSSADATLWKFERRDRNENGKVIYEKANNATPKQKSIILFAIRAFEMNLSLLSDALRVWDGYFETRPNAATCSSSTSGNSCESQALFQNRTKSDLAFRKGQRRV